MSAAGPQLPPLPGDADLARIETAALELARLAGAEILAALEREIIVEYKDEPSRGRPPTNPVSEVDRAVEQLIRQLLDERFPSHGVVAEEMDLHPDPNAEFVWAVDPVDGTMNFVNGFPLFASSIGVLHHGRPVAGAIWCSTGHELRPGVYHARRGGGLQFEQRPVPRGRPSVGVTRRLSAGPGGMRWRPPSTDGRTTGSAAIECAFAAAKVFASTLFWSPSIWDVAAGVTLVQAGGGVVRTHGPDGWQPFERFEAPSRVKEDRAPTLRDWRRPLAMGSPETIEELTRIAQPPRRPWWARLRPGARRRRR